MTPDAAALRLRMEDNVKCYYCDKESLYLCDFVLDIACAYKEPITKDMTQAEFIDKILTPPDFIDVKTCDRPLCEEHRVFKGWEFYSGEVGYMESRDVCPGHATYRGDNYKKNVRVGGGSAA